MDAEHKKILSGRYVQQWTPTAVEEPYVEENGWAQIGTNKKEDWAKKHNTRMGSALKPYTRELRESGLLRGDRVNK